MKIQNIGIESEKHTHILLELIGDSLGLLLDTRALEIKEAKLNHLIDGH